MRFSRRVKPVDGFGDDGNGCIESKGLIGAWETRGRELILYWRDLAPKQKIEVPLDLICRVPGEYSGPASRAYLYYNSDLKPWIEPLNPCGMQSRGRLALNVRGKTRRRRKRPSHHRRRLPQCHPLNRSSRRPWRPVSETSGSGRA